MLGSMLVQTNAFSEVNARSWHVPLNPIPASAFPIPPVPLADISHLTQTPPRPRARYPFLHSQNLLASDCRR